jgi:hypothetical protein
MPLPPIPTANCVGLGEAAKSADRLSASKGIKRIAANTTASIVYVMTIAPCSLAWRTRSDFCIKRRANDDGVQRQLSVTRR